MQLEPTTRERERAWIKDRGKVSGRVLTLWSMIARNITNSTSDFDRPAAAPNAKPSATRK